MKGQTRNKKGLESDKLLLDTINDYPGLSQYELTKKLGWQSGKVDGAIRRLLNQNQIQIKSIERNGRTVNLVYPKDSKPSNIIEVPANLLQVDNQTLA
jgi:predicted transcriptional regulator